MKETNNYAYLVGLKCVRSLKSEEVLGEIYLRLGSVYIVTKEKLSSLVGVLANVGNLPECQLHEYLSDHHHYLQIFLTLMTYKKVRVMYKSILNN